METKPCSRCNEVKPLTAFYDGSSIGRKQPYCITCQVQYKREWRENLRRNGTYDHYKKKANDHMRVYRVTLKELGRSNYVKYPDRVKAIMQLI